ASPTVQDAKFTFPQHEDLVSDNIFIATNPPLSAHAESYKDVLKGGWELNPCQEALFSGTNFLFSLLAL
ncbi:MAG: hypothetical protein J6L92_02590, partial [Clostridia bacterium]|nr:hypothetical protein [Clostridia bacterium]